MVWGLAAVHLDGRAEVFPHIPHIVTPSSGLHNRIHGVVPTITPCSQTVFIHILSSTCCISTLAFSPHSEQTRPPRVSAHRHQLPSLDADKKSINNTKYEPWKKSSATGLGRGEVSWKPPPMQHRDSNNAISGGGYHSSVASSHRRGGIHGRTDWTAK